MMKPSKIIPFDAYEIHGCKDFGGFVEQVPDAEADFWSLYGHITDQGLDCIGDFKTRPHAEEILERITGKPVSQNVHTTDKENLL